MTDLVSAAMMLRIAAVLAALQGAAHATMFVRARPRHGPAEEEVVDAMKSHRFDFAGSSRSYWDFYWGYGLQAAGACFVEAILFWLVAPIAAAQPPLARPIVALFVLVNLAHAAITMRYFFWRPVAADMVIATCLAWALAATR